MRRTIGVTAALMVLGLGIAGAQVTKRDYPGVRNFSRVDATFACGGATTPEAVAALKSDGFVSIINLRAADETEARVDEAKKAAADAGVKYFHLPFRATAPDAMEVADRFLATVQDPANQPAFIHCGSGSRVGALWTIKRVRLDGWPLEKALAEGRAIGLGSAELEQFARRYLETRPGGR